MIAPVEGGVNRRKRRKGRGGHPSRGTRLVDAPLHGGGTTGAVQWPMDAPQYQPPKPRQWIDIAVCTGIVLVLAALLLPVLQQVSANARDVACMGNVRARVSVLLHYATDYDDHLPPAAQWQSLTNTYFGEEKGACLEVKRHTTTGLGYAMDSRHSNATVSLGSATETPILLFESSNLTANAHDPGKTFTARHRTNLLGSSARSGYIGLMDGHVRSLEATEGKAITQRGRFPARN